jgi:hypothetical protein
MDREKKWVKCCLLFIFLLPSVGSLSMSEPLRPLALVPASRASARKVVVEMWNELKCLCFLSNGRCCHIPPMPQLPVSVSEGVLALAVLQVS